MISGEGRKNAGAASIFEHTRLQPVPFVTNLQLYLADELEPIWRLSGEMRGEADAPPFWAFTWVGGLAIARYLQDQPEVVAGKRVLDFATGSGLCAIAAMKAGAGSVLASDIDPFSWVAVRRNARANGVQVDVTGRDLLGEGSPDTDVILAGDICYEKTMAARALSWLRLAHAGGTRVILGDPLRGYLPEGSLRLLADYEVPASLELEDRPVKCTGVFTFPD